jgi:hypothetical protein
MASSKEYAYYIEGNQVAIIEKDVSFDNDVTSKEYGPGASRARWVSPKEAVTDGLEIKYVYSPTYRINETDKVDTQIDTYVATDGLLKLIDQGDNDYSASPESLVSGSRIVLTNAGKWNGLHTVSSLGTGYIITNTPCSESSTVQQAFEETPQLYYNVSELLDETFEFDLPLYLQKALVYYVKGKLAEDGGDLKLSTFFMREFKKMIEKHDTSKISGFRVTAAGPHSIR